MNDLKRKKVFKNTITDYRYPVLMEESFEVRLPKNFSNKKTVCFGSATLGGGLTHICSNFRPFVY